MRLFKWIALLVLIGLAYPGCADPTEDFIIELLRPYEWEMLKAGVAHYEKKNPGTFTRMAEIKSANEFYKELEDILDYPETGEKKKILESLNTLADKRVNRVYSVATDNKIHSLNYHAAKLYLDVFGTENELNAKLTSILNVAKNDPYICFLEGKDFMKKFIRKMDKLDGKAWAQEATEVDRLVVAMEGEEAIQAKVKELKAIYDTKAKLKVDNWAKLDALVKTWNKENREYQVSEVAFPIADEKCLNLYHEIVKGEKRYTEEACWKNISKNRQKELTDLASLYQTYSESSFEDSLAFKQTFNNKLNLFKGQLAAPQFYQSPIRATITDWITENLLYIIPGLIFLLGFVILYLKVIKPKLAAKKSSNHPPTSSVGNGANNLEVLNKQKDKEIIALKNENQQLRNTIEDLNRRVQTLEFNATRDRGNGSQQSQQNTPTHSSATATQPPALPSSYALRPDGDNGFLISSISTDADNNLYYELKLKEDGTGSYKLVENQNLQVSAAKSANVILEPACEYENMPFEINDSIITIRQGTLKNDGNQWTILEKAKIKFV